MPQQLDKPGLFAAGHYSCPPPPVCHCRWDDADWIRYIDAHGQWGDPSQLTYVSPNYEQVDGVWRSRHAKPIGTDV